MQNNNSNETFNALATKTTTYDNKMFKIVHSRIL